jgi:hypothetical protein
MAAAVLQGKGKEAEGWEWGGVNVWKGEGYIFNGSMGKRKVWRWVVREMHFFFPRVRRFKWP